MQSENNQVLEPYPISALRKILDCIEENKGVCVDISRVPLDDKKTLGLFKKGNTEGVFGFSSPDMQDVLKQLKPDSFNDLMILCALYGLEGMFRPAVFDMLPEYIARKTDKQKIDIIHPDLKSILSPTYGLIVYQDQVTEILCEIAGYNPENAETARRILAKKNPEKIAKLEPEFFSCCIARGYDRQTVSKIWDAMFPYAGQLGRRSLVSIYTFTAYQFTYLKAHYESEFYTATSKAK
ncbi:MAG: hypothetical protein IK114_03855 [Fibrobacter sp.]|nr:hypothetical protein [Fibrobacter sp.]